MCSPYCSTEQSISDPQPGNFSCDAENWAYGQATSESTAKDIISARISFPARAAIVPLLDWLPACVAHEYCNPEDPDTLGDDSSFFAVTPQQWLACVGRMLRYTLARKNGCVLGALKIAELTSCTVFTVPWNCHSKKASLSPWTGCYIKWRGMW